MGKWDVFVDFGSNLPGRLETSEMKGEQKETPSIYHPEHNN